MVLLLMMTAAAVISFFKVSHGPEFEVALSASEYIGAVMDVVRGHHGRFEVAGVVLMADVTSH